MAAPRLQCVCGCPERTNIRHHVIYRQELRRIAQRANNGTSYLALARDPRNLVPFAKDCHYAHHHPGVVDSRVLAMSRLPDCVFEFAVELLTAGPAYEYLHRHYRGSDERLDVLIGLHLSGR